MQRAFQAGAIIGIEITNALNDIVDIFVRYLPVAQHNFTVDIARGGLAPQVHDYL